MDGPIRTLIVHPQALFRQGIVALLGSYEHVELVCVTDDAERALRSAEQARPHAAVLELSDASSLEICRRVNRAYPSLPIVLMGVSRDMELIARAMHSGGTIYLPPDVRIEDLVASLEDVRRSGRRAGPKLASPVALEAPHPPISPRERDVLALVARGHANRQIAKALSISENTVRNHIASIFSKLRVKDRTEAAVQALRRGLV